LIKTEYKMRYRPARLIIPDIGSKDQRWHIIFYAYDAQLGKVVRKRFYDLPDGNTPDHRKFLAQQICQGITQKLAQGTIIDRTYQIPAGQPNLPLEIITRQKTSIVLQKVINQKHFKEQRTMDNYQSLVLVFTRYLKETNRDVPVDEFDTQAVMDYMQYIHLAGKSPRTSNNHLLTMRTLWAEAIKSKLATTNPWKEIPRLRTPIGKNLAYLPDQQKQILEFAAKYPTMLFLIKFMYYTLARTNEIAQLKIKNIGLYAPNKIFLPGSISKNDYDRHIIIPPALELEFTKIGLRQMDPEWYIFGNYKFNPGLFRMGTPRFGDKYRTWVIAKLGYSTEYTLYSWKHTGVIAAHKAGVSDDDIMKQTGHKDYGSFHKYLKSLGLYDNQDFADRIPVI
jgi:integrase